MRKLYLILVVMAILAIPVPVLAATTTDASGNYSFSNMPNGVYFLSVTDDNHILVPG